MSMRGLRQTWAASSWLVAFLAVAAVLTPAHGQQAQREYTLTDAIDSKLVAIWLCGMGASSGMSIIMAIQSRIGSPISVDVRSGTVLRSNNSSDQDMVVHRVERELDRQLSNDMARECTDAANREEERMRSNQDLADRWRVANAITLSAYQSQLYVLSAYCLDFEKENPGPRTGFSVQARAGSEISRMFDYLGRNPDEFDLVAIQLATWAINGNTSAGAIAEKFDFDSIDRDEACRLLREAGINPTRTALCTR